MNQEKHGKTGKLVKDIDNKTENMQPNDNISYHKQNIVKEIMEKYNISEKEAEEILKRVIIKSQHQSLPHYQDTNKNYNEINEVEKINNNLPTNKSKPLNQNNNFNNNSNNEVTKYPSNEMEKQQSQDVDTILSEIIPTYDQEVSIELNHVSLTFEVSNEKVDTLKEYFIRSFKRNNTKKFKIPALKDISFKVYKGEKVGIIGYNGAGKSTLLNVISGIYPYDEGEVKTNGNISPLLSLGAGFDHNYSGRKNIYLNGAVLGYDKEFLDSKVEEIIEFSELGDFIDIPIKNYSSGMLAKLGFSIATAVNPDILIIDEVLGVGDVNFQKKCKTKIRSLMDGGTTVLFVSHSIPQVRELCDKAIWIDNGELREIGEINKVCNHYLKDAEKADKNKILNIQFK